MNLYNHYKNKPYKVLGIAKHTETMEDVVVYECLYENPTGKLWVRPQHMFEESVQVDSKTLPRFKKVELAITTFTNFTPAQEEVLAPLIAATLGQWDPNWFYSKLKNHTRIHLLIASIENRPVAFKLGYEIDTSTFYSWLGGVLSDFQGLGIAQDLMEAQHTWCREQGYKKVQTKTQNRWKSMLLLNIRSGFEIIGYHSSDEHGPKIMLEKHL